MSDAEFGIAHRLPDQLIAYTNESVQTARVSLLGGGLCLDSLAIIGLIEFFLGKQAKLLIGLIKLHLFVTDFQRDAMPFAELLGDPDEMLIRRKHVKLEGS